ncbi:hypothetical protein FN846DRAFT_896325 [Sphaerosporella brunnea]|uniref:Uncharacterized protein n=1 Tax=Sphaerosporella brunnea TaxID=1250544 RepID=A0A5J5EDH1_9PEZI|nr:hypothetical protein FN846DRAFT_896325 [Sphaerosporella brunnea]
MPPKFNPLACLPTPFKECTKPMVSLDAFLAALEHPYDQGYEIGLAIGEAKHLQKVNGDEKGGELVTEPHTESVTEPEAQQSTTPFDLSGFSDLVVLNHELDTELVDQSDIIAGDTRTDTNLVGQSAIIHNNTKPNTDIVDQSAIVFDGELYTNLYNRLKISSNNTEPSKTASKQTEAESERETEERGDKIVERKATRHVKVWVDARKPPSSGDFNQKIDWRRFRPGKRKKLVEEKATRDENPLTLAALKRAYFLEQERMANHQAITAYRPAGPCQICRLKGLVCIVPDAAAGGRNCWVGRSCAECMGEGKRCTD